ncbi:hypothetical protein ST47_g3641 [Ascochyta rabiei]|uniref:DUF7918 domain-containing protein n=1 Tax=Didymella rabiei TaxID=5454 RepID=A0A163HBC3_DIDRA|nr:hypothetical protein ST47_g3641 [Ascochyta rabiei]
MFTEAVPSEILTYDISGYRFKNSIRVAVLSSFTPVGRLRAAVESFVDCFTKVFVCTEVDLLDLLDLFFFHFIVDHVVDVHVMLLNLRANTNVRYVEAEAGTKFAVRYSFGPPFPDDRDVALDTLAHGNIIRAPLVHKENIQSQKSHTVSSTKTFVDGEWVK